MADNKEKNTFIYAPEVQVLIATDSGVIDVSSDIISCQLNRKVNAVSMFAAQLNNRNQKYTGKLGRMNRIVVFMKRINKIQVFSGYLDKVPGFSLYTNTCEIVASCTLKRLMHTWWDPGLASSQEILNQYKTETATATPNAYLDPREATAKDRGLGLMMANVLTQVADWDEGMIHIQNIPQDLMSFALELSQQETENKKNVEILRNLLGITADAALGAIGLESNIGDDRNITPGAPIAGQATLEQALALEVFESSAFEANWIGTPPPGPAVERWRPFCLLALQLTGEDPANITPMMHRLNMESTGNPNAVNNYDSNAKKGTPSQGLLQCIPSTFRENAMPPFNTHIKSPVGSMLASIIYARNKYGNLTNAYMRSGGY